MFSKTVIAVIGFVIAGCLIYLISHPDTSTSLLIMIPVATAGLYLFILMDGRVEWILMAMIINIMIGSAELIENSILNFNRLIGGIVILFLFLDIFILKKRSLSFPRQALWILIFAATVFYSTLFSVDIDVSQEELRLYIRVCLLFFLITNVFNSKLWLPRLIYLLLFSGVCLTLFSIADAYSFKHYQIPLTDMLGLTSTKYADMEIMIRTRDPNRLYGALGSTKDVNYFALILVSLFPFSFTLTNKKKKWLIFCGYLSGAIILAGAVFSMSRAAVLALIVTSAILVARSIIDKKILFAGILAVVICLPFYSPKSFQRIFDIASVPLTSKEVHTVDDQNALNRLYYMKAGFLMFLDHPLTGVGIGNFRKEYIKYAPAKAPQHDTYAHNTYIQVLTETGLIGFIVFMGGIVICLRVLSKVRKAPELVSAPELLRIANLVEISLIAFLVGAFFVSAAFIDIFWILISCTAILDWLVSQQQSEREMQNMIVVAKD